ncbi:MAG TPA: cobalt-precorrin-6A reductase [Streptosporangiaceae bacterium]|nr:cobalt-precorrin-6A reductase [Streptosporangiaceae bacterium]
MTRTTILVLGGTAEARELASRLAIRPGLRVISSLVGRIADLALPAGEVRIGGFSGVDGLADWLRAQHVAAVIDATHPFAQAISAHAALACARSQTPLLRLLRPPWTAGPGDDWHDVSSPQAAAHLLPSAGRRAFLTTGRQGLPVFAALDQMWFLIRCASPPAGPLPAARHIILARGPYDADTERAIMTQHWIDVLVTKNSGGALTSGKLAAARQLGIPVVMIRRPPLADVADCSSPGDAVRWLLRQVTDADDAPRLVP